MSDTSSPINTETKATKPSICLNGDRSTVAETFGENGKGAIELSETCGMGETNGFHYYCENTSLFGSLIWDNYTAASF
ncbi:hypothetical protein LOK49_LG05G03624 [Camellia lanceoleosa]|uniref:Uncharacterized protein n=1 Tax=Camellia lanceoleosa TaxID=1840588 RepID=A0ACC0HT80_9ERIC|nr:hypothetical protein LOK49_LG05G03624 [Camellia lanceoleosa]